MTTKTELRQHHEREADRLRALAAAATTGPMRTRLLAEAEKHARVAEFGEELAEANAR